ncbi:MAG: mechanosensitive ion channel family protein [Rhodobacteraceae bacterium]|nr:mechanosensitive ion channel family protein [Paracoccaceae bacterium]
MTGMVFCASSPISSPNKSAEAPHWDHVRLLTLALAALLFTLLATPTAWAQFVPGASSAEAQATEVAPAALPEDLKPEDVDALLARLTDADIRALLRDELARRAEAQAEEAATEEPLSLRDRVGETLELISSRVKRWIKAIANIGDREEQVAARLAMGSGGPEGVLLSAVALLLAAALAAAVSHRLTDAWRRWLLDTDGRSYWDRVLRAVAMTFVELIPVIAFSIAIWLVTPLLGGLLGPLHGGGVSYVWIFQTGVAYGWMMIILSRRVNAPGAPQLRLADARDEDIADIHQMSCYGTLVGVGGWLIAGLFPALGYGFAPAMLLVALAGTLLVAIVLIGLLRNLRAMREGLASFHTGREQVEEPSTLGAMFTNAAPWAMVGYLTLAYLYWLERWVETGQLYIIGPLGTLLVWLLAPVAVRLGDETIAEAMSARSETAQRFRPVLAGAWRVLLLFASAIFIARLWGVPLHEFVKGEDAPAWIGAAFDIAITLLIGQLIWRLIQAALYQEKHVAGGEDIEELTEEAATANRLKTLLPLLRNLMLMVLSVVVVMIVLSSLGVDIGPLLASAGIIGIAIGFGAQTLVRDIFSGMFFLIDDAFRVGEYIELEGDLRGEVEAISIRSLQLRHHRGAILTIPFGELKNVTNHSRDWVIYKMSFRLEPETDPAMIKKVVKRIGTELMEDPEHGHKFFEPLKSQGVFMIDEDSALVIRVKFKAKPRTQFILRREVYHRLRAAFAENDIRFARRKVEVVSPGVEEPDGAAAVGLAALGASAALATEENTPSTLAGAGDAQ